VHATSSRRDCKCDQSRPNRPGIKQNALSILSFSFPSFAFFSFPFQVPLDSFGQDASPFALCPSHSRRNGTKCCCPQYPCPAREARGRPEPVGEAREAFSQNNFADENWAEAAESRSWP